MTASHTPAAARSTVPVTARSNVPVAASAYARGFAPVTGGESARVLILGSLPGQCSLRRAQYYAQPQNVFWRLMGELFQAGPELDYDERMRRLVARRVALWDVCAAAERPGSLDSAIVPASIAVNDFAAFFSAHPQLRLIGFNGATAARLFERQVLGRVATIPAALQLLRLPSTSPAHAAMPYAAKLAAWRSLLAAV
jgi:hypoxanthine-DNA glycosylase